MRPILLTIAFVLLYAICCSAWGREGHGIVGRIAMQYVSPATKEKIKAILGNTSVEDAADWMDAIRSDEQYNYMHTWHYININRGKQFDYVAAMSDDNVFHAITNAVLKLQQQNLSTAEQKQQVMILMHLVGDLHQPLHDSYEDKGGNSVNVWFRGRQASLHRIWDEDLIREEDITYETVLAVANAVTPAQLAKEKMTSPGQWIDEARGYLPAIYDIGNGQIGADYARKSKQIIERQLAMGGIRLGLLLDRVLSNVHTMGMTAAGKTTAQATSFPARKEATGSGPNPKYTPEEAANHIGEVACVCGTVVDAKLAGDDKILLDMNARYPNNPVTVVARTQTQQGNLRKIMKDYLGKTICVTGKITRFKGKANMELNLDQQ